MIPKYTIEYTLKFRQHAQPLHHSTDDPVAAGEFLLELLELGFPIHKIRHEGVELSRHDADKMIKNAAGMLAAKHIRTSLGIDAEEERYRFGFCA
jgi:hypothetical protein